MTKHTFSGQSYNKVQYGKKAERISCNDENNLRPTKTKISNYTSFRHTFSTSSYLLANKLYHHD